MIDNTKSDSLGLLSRDLELRSIAVPNFLYPGFGFGSNKRVAVIASISSIKSNYILGGEGERQEVRIGVGELIDIFYLGKVGFN